MPNLQPLYCNQGFSRPLAWPSLSNPHSYTDLAVKLDCGLIFLLNSDQFLPGTLDILSSPEVQPQLLIWDLSPRFSVIVRKWSMLFPPYVLTWEQLRVCKLPGTTRDTWALLKYSTDPCGSYSFAKSMRCCQTLSTRVQVGLLYEMERELQARSGKLLIKGPKHKKKGGKY